MFFFSHFLISVLFPAVFKQFPVGKLSAEPLAEPLAEQGGDQHGK